MHLPNTILENVTVYGRYNDQPLHRWTEEGGTRVFEERVVTVAAASGTNYRGVQVFELAAALNGGLGLGAQHGLPR